MEVTPEMAGAAITAIVATAGGAGWIASLLVKNQVLESVSSIRVEIQQWEVRSAASNAQHEVTRHEVRELREMTQDHEERLRALESRE